jgi:hypothetical protein
MLLPLLFIILMFAHVESSMNIYVCHHHHIYIHVHICICSRMYLCMHACMYKTTYMYVTITTQTHKHTYMAVYSHSHTANVALHTHRQNAEAKHALVCLAVRSIYAAILRKCLLANAFHTASMCVCRRLMTLSRRCALRTCACVRCRVYLPRARCLGIGIVRALVGIVRAWPDLALV